MKIIVWSLIIGMMFMMTKAELGLQAVNEIGDNIVVNSKIGYTELNLRIAGGENIDLTFKPTKDGYKFYPQTLSNRIEDMTYTLTSDKEWVLLEHYTNDTQSVYGYVYEPNPDDFWNEYRDVFTFEKECENGCTWELSKDRKTFTINFRNNIAELNADYTNVSSCSTLSVSGQYKLNTSLTATGTCMTISGSNIGFDCLNYSIVYGTTTASLKYGIFVSGSSNNITNCNVKGGGIGNNNYPIYITGGTEILKDNNITSPTGGSTQNGIYMVGTDNTQIIYNNITTSTSGTDNIECYSSCTGNIYANNYIKGILVAISLHTNNNNLIIQNNTFFTAKGVSGYNTGAGNIIRHNNIHSTTSQGIIFSTGTWNNNLIEYNIMNGSASAIYFNNIIGTGNNITNNNVTVNGANQYGVYIAGGGATNSQTNAYIANNIVYIKGSSVGIGISARAGDILTENNTVYVGAEGGYGVRGQWAIAEPDNIFRNNRVFLTANNSFCYAHHPHLEFSNVSFENNYCEVSSQKGIVYFQAGCNNNEMSFDISDFTFNNTYKNKVREIKGNTRVILDDSICNGAWAYRYIKED